MTYFEEEEFKRSFDINVWKKALPFVRPYVSTIALVAALMILLAVVDISMPLFLRYAVDNFVISGTTQGIWSYALVYLTAITIQTLGVIIFIRKAIFVEVRVGRDMKRAAFMHLQTLGLDYYNTTPVGYIIARVMSDTDKIGTLASWGIVDGLWSFSYIIGVFITMTILNWQLALIVMTVIPFIALVTWYFQKRILESNRTVRKENSRITGAYNEGIMGARTSKTLVIEEANIKGFKKISGNMYNASVRASCLNALYITVIAYFGSIVTVLVLYRGGYAVANDLLEFGTFSAFISFALGIFHPIQQLARVIADTVSAQASIERVTTLLENRPSITDTTEVIDKYGDVFSLKKDNWEPICGDIEFDHVSFQYPDGDELVLDDFCMKIPAGTTVAIVGETGAGKSTLVNLACRFFEPTKGRILIDGVDYRERSQLWLHSNIGYVLQSPHLFSGTVRENIRFGNLDASDEQVEQVARQVSAETVVNRLEKGYESDVGEGGDRLSTGEKQLISFARATLANPRIFVLDEATSSVDTKTEKLIQDAIAHILKDRTSFVVAHRLSTIRHADLILVIKDGKIVERGKHGELLKQKGYYYTLCSLQYKEEATTVALRGKG